MAIDYGRTFKRLREEHGMDQRKAAKLFGVCQQTISKWETGRAMPNIKAIEWIYEHNQSRAIYDFLVWYEGGSKIFLDGKGREIVNAYIKYLKGSN